MLKHILSMLPRTKIGKPDNSDAGSGVPSGSAANLGNTEDTLAQGTAFGRVVATMLTESVGKANSEATHLSSITPSYHVNGVQTVSFRVGDGDANYAYEPLPLFRDVASSERENLFIRKLSLCSIVFDFTDTTKNAKEKEIKRKTLIELVDFVSSVNSRFSELAIKEAIQMVASNLFRSFPPAIHENTGVESFEAEEEEPNTEPAWAHLHFVYEFCLRFIMSSEMDAKIAKRYIDHSFVLKLVDLFDSEDPREREFLKSILHKIYSKFMVYRPFIRRAIGNIFYRFIFETERHNGIAELLEILGSIINGLALPLKEEHKLFLVRALIPLHKPKCVFFYHRQLSHCIIQFVEKDLKLADTVIKGLLKYWPVTNSQKEVLFLGELEEVLEITEPAEFQRCMVPLFRQIGRCLNSSHFQVAERALFLLNNDHIVSLATQNRSIILPVIYSALEKNTRGHWNQAIHSLTLNARKIFIDMDQQLFQECELKFEEEEEKAKLAEERRELTWQRLEAAATGSMLPNHPVMVQY